MDPEAQVTLPCVFGLIPSEIMDIITDEVRRDSPQSFHALEGTCTELRNSARRCTQTLILKHPSSAGTTTVRCRLNGSKDGNFGEGFCCSCSTCSLAREIRLRPCLKNLVVLETDLATAEDISRVSWKFCTLSGAETIPACKIHEVGLSNFLFQASNDSLRELTLTGFSIEFESLQALLELLSQLRRLKGCNCEIRTCWPTWDAVKSVELENLTELDLSGTLYTRPIYEETETGTLVPGVRGSVFKAPRLRYWTIGRQKDDLPRTADCRDLFLWWELLPFPSTLEILHLDYWYGCPLLASLIGTTDNLEEAACPMLREIHLRNFNHTAQCRIDFRLTVAYICVEFPHLEKFGFRASSRDENGEWTRIR